MKRATVLFYLPILGAGGAEMNAVRVARGLLDHHVQPTYAVARGPGPYGEHLPAGVDEIVLQTGSYSSSTYRLLMSVRPLAKLIDELRPDCICPVMVAPAIAAILAASLAHHKPAIVLSIQNTLELPKGTGWHPYEAVENFLARRLFHRADRIIALSHGVAKHLAEFSPRLAAKIEVVHNVGVPLPSQLVKVDPESIPAKRHAIRYLACGRLTQQKGYIYLLEAFSRVIQHIDAELHILGDGPMKQELQLTAQRLGVSERVSFLGFRKNPFLHMKEADVFVLASLWEGFANVIVEAMSMGTAVVATQCPFGPDEIISPEKNGLLVPPADSSALADAMLRLARDCDARRRIAEAGLHRSGDFSASRISARYAHIFHEVAAHRRPGPKEVVNP